MRLGIGAPGAQGKHVDTRRLQLAPERFPQAVGEGLARGIGGRERNAHKAFHGTGKNHSASAPFQQCRQEAMGELHGRRAIDLQQCRHALRFVVLVRPLEPEARIADQQADVHALRRFRDCIHRSGIGQVRRAHRHLDVVRSSQFASQVV